MIVLPWAGGTEPDALIPRAGTGGSIVLDDVPVLLANRWYWRVRKWRAVLTWDIDPAYSLSGSSSYSVEMLLERNLGPDPERTLRYGWGAELGLGAFTSWQGEVFPDVSDVEALFDVAPVPRMEMAFLLFGEGYAVHGENPAIPVGSIRPSVAFSASFFHHSTGEHFHTLPGRQYPELSHPQLFTGLATVATAWSTELTVEGTTAPRVAGPATVTLEPADGTAGAYYGYDGYYSETTGEPL